MPKEPNAQWTVETALRHILVLMNERDRRYEQRFRSQQVAVDAALNSSKEAVMKAELATEKRFEGVNEFRGAMSDAAGKYITRSEALALVVAVCAIAGVVEFALTYFVHR